MGLTVVFVLDKMLVIDVAINMLRRWGIVVFKCDEKIPLHVKGETNRYLDWLKILIVTLL